MLKGYCFVVFGFILSGYPQILALKDPQLCIYILAESSPNWGRLFQLLPVILRLLLLRCWLPACLPVCGWVGSSGELLASCSSSSFFVFPSLLSCPPPPFFFFFFKEGQRSLAGKLSQPAQKEVRTFPLPLHLAASPHPEDWKQNGLQEARVQSPLRTVVRLRLPWWGMETMLQSFWTPTAQLWQGVFPTKAPPYSSPQPQC